MNRSFTASFLAALVLPGPAACGGGDPAAQTRTIDAFMAKGVPLTEQQRTDIERYVAEGRERASAGDLDQAGAAFDEAIRILKFAEDAAMFNNSE